MAPPLGSLVLGLLKGHTNSVRSVVFSPDDTLIASCSADGTVRIWDAHTGAPLGEPLQGHDGEVNSVTFSPHGNRIASGSDDGTVRIWDACTRAPIGEPLQAHENWVWSVAFSPNNNLIASGSQDCTICVWDAYTGAPIREIFEQHDSPVLSVAFSHDSNRVASGYEDGTIHVWDVLQNAPLIDAAPFDTPSFDTPSFDTVSNIMSAQEIFECLVRHGCTDLSPMMHPDRYSPSAITRGGFGDIWLGELTNGLVVAIKCVWLHVVLEGDWKGMKRAMRETYIWSKAQHENVQQLTGIIMFQGRLGMVSPWMEDAHLLKYLEIHPETERYPLCVQLASGVAYLHGIGMVHGDLKALNVLVSPDGVLKINDFDYAILSNSTLRFSMTSKVGGGTLRWMAPELLQQEGDEPSTESTSLRTKQTDIYALGMTMLESLTGKPPYVEFRNDMAIYRAIDKKQPPKRPKSLAEIDDKANQMWDLLLKCWDHNPVVRPDARFILGYLRVLVL